MSDYLGPYLLGPNDENQGIYTGDARELARAIPDESVDLIFTDPVYQNIEDYRWLAETAVRALKPDSACLAFYGIGWTEQTFRALREGGRPVTWLMPVYQPGQTQRIHPRCFNHWYGLLWIGGHPRRTFVDVQVSKMSTLNGSHKWRKNPAVLAAYIRAFSDSGHVVLDPFTGGGTVPAVCKMLGRRWLAFEIDPDTAERARERVRNTQPPLFVMEPEQMGMEL